MVTDYRATRVFRALADPTRRQILESLRREPLPVHDLSARFAISRPAISRHLRVLKVASLVRARSTGRETYYALNQEPMTLVQHWLDQFWTARLSGLKRLAEEENR